MKALIFLLTVAMPFFLFGCSKTDAGIKSVEEGTVHKAIFGWGDETSIGAGKLANSGILIEEDQSLRISRLIFGLTKQMKETQDLVDGYWEKEAMDAGDMKTLEDWPKNHPAMPGATKDKKVEDPQLKKSSYEKVRDKLEDRIKELKLLKIKIDTLDLLSADKKTEIKNNLSILEGKLSSRRNTLENLKKSEDIIRLGKEVMKMSIFGVELTKTEEMLLVYQCQYLLEKELTPLFLEVEGKIGEIKNQGGYVSNKEAFLAQARQISIQMMNALEETGARFNSMAYSSKGDESKNLLNAGREKLGEVSKNLEDISSVLASLAQKQ